MDCMIADDNLRKDNAALKLENGALLQQNKELQHKTNELQHTIDELKEESRVLSDVIEQLNVQLSDKPKLLGDLVNFSGLQNPENVSCFMHRDLY